MNTVGGSQNTTTEVYYQGVEDSQWQIPITQDFLDDNYVLKAGDTMTGGLIGTTADFDTSIKTASFTITDQYTLPTTDGSADQIWKTDGAGTLSWIDQPVSGSGAAALMVAVDGVKISSPTIAMTFNNQFTGLLVGNTVHLRISTAAPTNADTTHIPNCDQVYNFVTGQSYITAASTVASATDAGLLDGNEGSYYIAGSSVADTYWNQDNDFILGSSITASYIHAGLALNVIDTSSITIGTDDTYGGRVLIYGDDGGLGGAIRMYNSDDEDGTEDWWEWQVEGTQKNLGIEEALTAFQFYSAGNFIAAGNVSGNTYASDASVSDAELKYINTLGSNAQDQINAKAPSSTALLIADAATNYFTLAGSAAVLRISDAATNYFTLAESA